MYQESELNVKKKNSQKNLLRDILMLFPYLRTPSRDRPLGRQVQAMEGKGSRQMKDGLP